ncbi:MAG: right-handed parallel beta-helix repeat-containing protein [Verrucomicrobiales bacterium]|nr:right-handed parallel beta-helix repeat-containing protein [Verrucomicrobiales bacterium]
MSDTRGVRGRDRKGASTAARWVAVVAALVGGMHGGWADFFVAPNGSDSHPGTADRPFATFEAAREAVRAAKRDGPLPVGGLTVWIKPGDYVRTSTLELTAADSGLPGAPVVWSGMPGGRTRWLGGRLLQGFQPVSDPGLRARLPDSVRDQVRILDLRTVGLTHFGMSMTSRGFGRSTVPAHRELFFGGRPMPLARWPNEGSFEKIAGFPDDAGMGDSHGGKIGRLEGGFLYAGDRPKRWKSSGEIWVHGYWAWDWANSYERIESLDVEKRWIKTATPHGLYGFRSGQRFYFLNVLEELDAPGEWHWDSASGSLLFLPPGPLESSEVLLSVLDKPLLRLDGASHVVVRGLDLEATRASGVEIRGGASNRVEGCLVRNVGNHGVVVDGGRGHAVVACDVLDTGDAGVTLAGGDRATLVAGAHQVENCHFRRQGRWSKCYVPAVLLQGVGMRVAGCLIEDHPHCGILYSGNDHRIEFNEIRRVALETGDVGAIYTGRDYSFRGNQIRHNYLHHTGGVGMGSMGVYMDDCVSGTEIYGNVFHKVQRAAFLGGGRDHVVANNIFVDCDHAVELDGRGLDRSPVWREMVQTTMRQRLTEVPLALFRERYPALRDLDRFYGAPGGAPIDGDRFQGVPPENNRVSRNVCVGKWTKVYWHAQPEHLLLRDNWVGVDPGFARPIGGGEVPVTDFALQPDSPVWKLGFEKIPVDRIGLRDDGLRREWRRERQP